MRHEDAGLALWLANDESRRDHELACEQLTAALAAQGVARPSIRQRAGAAVIAFGERLAGDSRPATRRPLARPTS